GGQGGERRIGGTEQRFVVANHSQQSKRTRKNTTPADMSSLAHLFAYSDSLNAPQTGLILKPWRGFCLLPGAVPPRNTRPWLGRNAALAKNPKRRSAYISELNAAV